MLTGTWLLTLSPNVLRGDELTCTGVRKKPHQGVILMKILSTVSLPVIKVGLTEGIMNIAKEPEINGHSLVNIFTKLFNRTVSTAGIFLILREFPQKSVNNMGKRQNEEQLNLFAEMLTCHGH